MGRRPFNCRRGVIRGCLYCTRVAVCTWQRGVRGAVAVAGVNCVVGRPQAGSAHAMASDCMLDHWVCCPTAESLRALANSLGRRLRTQGAKLVFCFCPVTLVECMHRACSIQAQDREEAEGARIVWGRALRCLWCLIVNAGQCYNCMVQQYERQHVKRRRAASS